MVLKDYKCFDPKNNSDSMKAKLFLISFFFLFSCSKSTSERQLNTIINSYENNKARGDDSPLGQYTESRFEDYARFCDSLKIQL